MAAIPSDALSTILSLQQLYWYLELLPKELYTRQATESLLNILIKYNNSTNEHISKSKFFIKAKEELITIHTSTTFKKSG